MLNERQERFCQLVASGRPHGRAYEEAGYSAKGRSADAQAAKLVAKGNVQARIAELMKENASGCRLSREQAMAYLCDIIETPVGDIDPQHKLAQEYREPGETTGGMIKMPAKLDAFKELAKMCGWYEPDKIEHSVTDEIAEMMMRIRKRK